MIKKTKKNWGEKELAKHLKHYYNACGPGPDHETLWCPIGQEKGEGVCTCKGVDARTRKLAHAKSLT